MKYRIWVYTAITLFVVSSVIGWATPQSMAHLLAEDIAALQNLSQVLASLPPLLTALIILAKNSLSLVTSFVLSPILCLVPLIALIANGWLIGWVSATHSR